jgi:hypothetical protein
VKPSERAGDGGIRVVAGVDDVDGHESTHRDFSTYAAHFALFRAETTAP